MSNRVAQSNGSLALEAFCLPLSQLPSVSSLLSILATQAVGFFEFLRIWEMIPSL